MMVHLYVPRPTCLKIIKQKKNKIKIKYSSTLLYVLPSPPSRINPKFQRFPLQSSSYQLLMESSFCPIVLSVICEGHRKKFIKTLTLSRHSLSQPKACVPTTHILPHSSPGSSESCRRGGRESYFCFWFRFLLFSLKEGSPRKQLAQPLT